LAATKEILGLDPAQSLVMPEDALTHARLVRERGAEAHRAWDRQLDEWRAAHPDLAGLLDDLTHRSLNDAARSALAEVRDAPQSKATRIAGSAVLDAVAPHLPWLWGGSADLAESNGVAIAGAPSFVPTGYDGVQWPGGPDGILIHFGVREHAMGAILNGIALGGLSRPFGATFFVFSDYMRPSVRLAALMQVPTI